MDRPSPSTAVSSDTVPARWLRLWTGAALILLAAYAAVLLTLAAMHAHGNYTVTPPSIAVPANRLELVIGTGGRTANAVVIEALDGAGLAVVSSHLTPFAARAYPRVEWQLASSEPGGLSIVLLWFTREQPGRTFSKPIVWSGAGPAIVDLGDEADWRGSIGGVALAVRGQLTQPLAVASVKIPGVSLSTVIADIVRQWGSFFPFRGITMTLPFDEERNQYLPMLPATALALALASLAYALRARLRRQRLDARVFLALLAAGWLVLDARWEANLLWQLGQTAQRFAGKSGEQKYLASVDHDVFEFIRKINDVLPPPPARVLFLTDSYALRTRGSYFFYPRNVYHDLSADNPGIPNAEELHSGDFVVLFLPTGLAYDREPRMLAWPDGRRKGVEELLYEDPGPIVLRVK